jgi:hypothetical protein
MILIEKKIGANYSENIPYFAVPGNPYSLAPKELQVHKEIFRTKKIFSGEWHHTHQSQHRLHLL